MNCRVLPTAGHLPPDGDLAIPWASFAGGDVGFLQATQIGT